VYGEIACGEYVKVGVDEVVVEGDERVSPSGAAMCGKDGRGGMDETVIQ
jgi:hypothetical protein